MNIAKALEEAAKIIERIGRVANAVDALHATAQHALPKLKIPNLRHATSAKDVREEYERLVAELKAERAAHEKTRQHLNWATREIENVKVAMREWQDRALRRQSIRRHRTQRRRGKG